MHSVRTGEIAFNHAFGVGLWEYYAQHPEQAKIFDDSMANLIAANSAAVLASYPFSTIDTLVDVGGGNGSFIVSALHANPRMKGVLFDLPHVAKQARKRIADAGLAERCEVIGGTISCTSTGVYARCSYDGNNRRARANRGRISNTRGGGWFRND
jgi:O-methyltransferase domain